MGRNDKPTPQELSGRLLTKELDKLEIVKRNYFKEAEVLENNISVLKTEYQEVEAQLREIIKDLKAEISRLEGERNKLAVQLSQERSGKEKVLEGLKTLIADKETERAAISLSFDEKEKEMNLKLQTIGNKTAELNTLRDNIKDESLDLDIRERAHIKKTEEDTARIDKSLGELKAQTEISIGETKKMRVILLEKETLLKNVNARIVILDSKIVEASSFEERGSQLDIQEQKLNERIKEFETTKIDVETLRTEQEDTDKDLKIREKAVVVREKNVLRKEKQLKEAQNGQN